MNSRQAMEFQSEFQWLLEKYNVGTFMLQAFIVEDGNIQGLLLGNVAGDSPKGSSQLVMLALDNLFSVMAKYNGLTPNATAGAMHAMVDEVLDEVQEEAKGPQPEAAQA